MCIHPPFGGWIGIYKNLWCVIPLPPTIDWGLQLLKMIRFITHTSGGGKLSWIRICMCVRVCVCVCLSVCVCAFMSETQQVSIYLSFSLCDYFHLSLLTKAQTWCVCLGGSALCLCAWSVWFIGLKRFFSFLSFSFFILKCCLYWGLLKHTQYQKEVRLFFSSLSHIPFVGLCKYLFSLTVLPDLDGELSSTEWELQVAEEKGKPKATECWAADI